MSREELKTKYLCAIEDTTLKKIYVTILRSENYSISIKQLSKELNLSQTTIKYKFKEASNLVFTKMQELEDIKLKSYVKKCYSIDDLLLFDEIAKYHKIDTNELKEIFDDYILSFKEDENIIADRFPFSMEALKKGNIQTLKYRVKGYSKNPKHIDEVFYKNVKEQDIQFLQSVSDICKNYYLNHKKINKAK